MNFKKNFEIEKMFYYSKEGDFVCRLDRERNIMNFGNKDTPIEFKEDGITVHKWDYIYHFYSSTDSPQIEDGDNHFHLYPVGENQVSLSEGSYIFKESVDVGKLLKEAYIVIRRGLVEGEHNEDGSINHESFEWNVNEIHQLSKKILLHLDRNDNEVEENREKIQDWAEN